MRALASILKIIRPVNFVITFAAVYIAGLLALNQLTVNNFILLASFSAAFIAAGGNIINDIFDIEIDKTSHPERPLPSGKISVPFAIVLYLLFTILGVYFSYIINNLTFGVAVFAVALLFFYSCCIKKLPLINNFTVASMTGLAFIYGGLAVQKIEITIMPALFALLANLSRELLKDIEDIEGDTAAGVNTFPALFGVDSAVQTAKLSSAMLIVLTVIAYFTEGYSVVYLPAIALVDLGLVYFLIALKNNPGKKEVKKFSALLKIIMVLGLVAVWLGAWK